MNETKSQYFFTQTFYDTSYLATSISVVVKRLRISGCHIICVMETTGILSLTYHISDMQPTPSMIITKVKDAHYAF